jgi:guanylate kinase
MSSFAGKLIVFSGPSGSGKTTVVRHLLGVFPALAFSISATSRTKRNYEIEGEDYYFMSESQFKKGIDNGDFLEWEEVYEGRYYGTLKKEVERLWTAGRHVIFDIDVQGAINLKKLFPDNSFTVFIMPPSSAILKKRLMERNTESPEFLKERIAKAGKELSYSPKFDFIIINHLLEDTFTKAEKIVATFLSA